jgi:hypothetical protein
MSQISAKRKESRKLLSREQMNYNLHNHHPVRLKETRENDEECEKRQESLRRRRRKLLSVSVDLPNTDPVYSRHDTPVSKNRALTTEHVSHHIQKFGECMDPNSDLGMFAYELQNSLGTSFSEEELGVPGLACKAHNKQNAICGTIDDTANNGTLFGDEICARLSGTLATAIDGVNACFHRRSAAKSRRPSSSYILPEYSQEMRWPMTHSQLEEIWGDEISMLRLNGGVSSYDRRDGKETVASLSPRSDREQPPQYTSAYFDYVTIKDIPFVQGMDVAVAPTCYIPTTNEPQQTMADTKPEEPPVSSAETTCSKSCAPVTNVSVECSSQGASILIQTPSSNTGSKSDRGNESTVRNNVETRLQGELVGRGEEFTSKCIDNEGKTISSLGISNCDENKDNETQSKQQEYSQRDPPTSTLDFETLDSCSDKMALPSNSQELATLPNVPTSDVSCTLQHNSKIDPPTTSIEIDPRENSVDSTAPSPKVQDAVSLQNRSSSDYSGDLKEAAIDECVLNGRIANTPKEPTETSPLHKDLHASDLQANPSDFWDGEIEFIEHSSASVRRQKSALNKYASKTLHERSHYSSGASKDQTTSEKIGSEKNLDLTQLLSCSVEVERSVEQLRLQQDIDHSDDAKVNEDLLRLADETRACASNSAGDDQELEHIEIVHVEESFDQGDFFQSGETNGIIFAAPHAGAIEDVFALLGEGNERDHVDATDNFNEISSVDESRSPKSLYEPCVEDVSESSSINVDDYSATFLGVIPGKIPTYSKKAKIVTANEANDEQADKKSYFASAKSSLATDVQSTKTDDEFIGYHSEAARLENAIRAETKLLTDQSALSLVHANPLASSVLFFKPTINVFGGESGANDLAALTRAFSKLPDVSSGRSDREKSFGSPFEFNRQNNSKSKTNERWCGTFCDNDDDSFTKELSRLATSERLLREELESFQRKLSKASETRTIIDLSMIDDSYGSTFPTNSNKDLWDCKSTNGFASNSDMKTQIGNQGRRVFHSYPTQRAPLTAIVRNENPPYIRQCTQQPFQSANHISASDGRVNAKIDLLRSRLNQKRSALRTAIDSQRIAGQMDHFEQKDISQLDDAGSTISFTWHESEQSVEEILESSENDPFENTPGYYAGNAVNIVASYSNSFRESTLPTIDNSGSRSSNLSSSSTRRLKSNNQFGQFSSRPESGDHLTGTHDFPEDDLLEFPQIEVALSPNSLEFTTEDGLTFKGIEMSSFHSGMKSSALSDVCFDKSEAETGTSSTENDNDPVTESKESKSSESKSSGYISLSDDSSSFRFSESDGSRQLSQHITPPGVTATNSTTSSLSLQEHLPVFTRQEDSVGSLSSRLSLLTIDSSKAEQMLVSYRESQRGRDPLTVNLFSKGLTPSQKTSVASCHRHVRFDLPLLLEPKISYNISSDLDDVDAYVPGNNDVVTAPFLSSLSTGQSTSDTKADPPGCLEKDPDEYLTSEAEFKPYVVLNSSHPTENTRLFKAGANEKEKEAVHKKKILSKRPQRVSSCEAPREMRISVPSKNTYLDKLKLSKDLRKSILLGHKKKSKPL